MLLAAVLLLLNVAVVSTLGASPAQATTAPFAPTTTFEIDGDLAASGGGDWTSSLAPGYGAYTTAGGHQSYGVTASSSGSDSCTADPSGFPGSQTISSATWTVGNAAPNNKSDLCAAGTAFELVNVGGEYKWVLYAYWARRPKGGGDVSVFVNFSGPAPGRVDDKLLSFDVNPSGSVSSLIYTWNGSAWTGGAPLGNTVFQAVASANTFPEVGGAPDADPFTFAEVAINLTDAGLLSTTGCSAFAVPELISRTGNSNTAQLQDQVVLGAGNSISNCGRVSVTKQTTNDLPGGPFSYRLGQTSGRVHADGVVPADSLSGEPDTDGSSGTISNTLTVPGDVTDTWADVIASPDYTLQELSLPNGWATQSVQCTSVDLLTGNAVTQTLTSPTSTFQVPPATASPGGTSCVISNATSGVRVVKAGLGSTTDEFGFDVDGDLGGTSYDRTLRLGQDTGYLTFTPGSRVTIAETLPAATPSWRLVGISCVDDATGQSVGTATLAQRRVVLTAQPGTTTTCTYTNQQQARIRVAKDVAPDGADTFDFTGAVTATLGDGDRSGWVEVDPNTGVVAGATPGNGGNPYQVTEAGDADYTLTALTCDDATTPSTGSLGDRTARFRVAPGESVTCSFVNSRRGSLTIIKQAAPHAARVFDFTSDNTAGSMPGAFSLTDPDATSTDGDRVTFTGLPVGTYAITEAATSGWTLTGITCTDRTGNTTVDVTDRRASIEVDPGESITCVFENRRNRAQLTLTKEWVGAPAGEGVSFTAQGTVDTVVSSGSSTSGASTTDAVRTWFAGETVTLDEDFAVPANAAHYTTTLTCRRDSDGAEVFSGALDGALSRTITAGADPVDITCTFRNEARTATVELVKDWDGSPANGDTVELAVDDFAPGSATGSDSNDGTSGNDVAASLTVATGQPVTLSESFTTGTASWYTRHLSCADGALTYPPNALTGTLTLPASAAGTTVRCTFTNNRRSAELTLAKTWVDGRTGDTAVLTANADEDPPDRISVTATAPVDAQASATVWAGETIELAETTDGASYSTAIVCRDTAGWAVHTFSGRSGAFSVPDAPVDLTCTVVNTRETSTLTLRKAWVDAVAGDTADLSVVDLETGAEGNATSTADGSTGTWTDAGQTAVTTVLSGGEVYLAEDVTSASSYAADLACTYVEAGGAQVAVPVRPATDADADAAGRTLREGDQVASVPTAAGLDITCTYTNSAPRGTIVVVKNVAGADGTFDFTGSWLDDPGFRITTDGGTGAVTTDRVLAGTYTVAEVDTASPGYDFTRLVCTDPSGDTTVDGLTGTLDLDAGETITCTFTNTQKSTVVITKDARPDDTQDFVFTTTSDDATVPAELATVALDDNGDDTDSASSTVSALVAGGATYTITEQPTAGWHLAQASSVCTTTDATGAPVSIPVAADGSVSVTPLPGATVTCSYVNDAEPASLTLTKSTLGAPADYGWAFDVTLSPAQPATQTVTGTTPGTGSVTWAGLAVNQVHTLTETVPAGWIGGSFTCEGLTDADLQAPGFQVVPEPAQELECSLVNTWVEPELVLVKDVALDDANGDGFGNPGEQVTWSFVVTNDGPTEVTGLTIADALLDELDVDVTCPVTTLAPGASTTCTSAAYELTAGDVAAGSLDNTATATASLPEPPSGGTAPTVTSNEDFASVPLAAAPSLALVKTAHLDDTNGDGLGSVGEEVTWSFEVTNTGPTPLSSPTVNDALLDSLGLEVTCPVTGLAAGESTTCTSEAHVVTPDDVAAGSIDNVATATALTANRTTITSDEDETSTPTGEEPSLSLVKTAVLDDTDGNDVGNIGETVAWTFAVTNTGPSPLDAIEVQDPLLDGLGLTVTCPVTTLAAGASTTCTSSAYEITAADAEAGTIDNVATGTGETGNGTTITSNQDETSTPTEARPATTLLKTAAVADGDGDGLADPGETITWSFEVANTGDTAVVGLQVVDPLLTSLAIDITCPVTSLAPGETTTCVSAPYTVTKADGEAGEVHNVAIAAGTTPGGEPVTSPEDDVTTPTDDPSAGLALDKVAHLVDTDGDELADQGETVTWTFEVANTGELAVEDIALDDPLLSGLGVAVTCPSTALAAGESMTCQSEPWTVTTADVEAGEIHNVATASGTASDGDPVTPVEDETTTPVAPLTPITPRLVIDKEAHLDDADGDGRGDLGETITWSFEVRNAGDVELTGVAVDDPLLVDLGVAVTCPSTVLAAGESMTCESARYAVTQADVDRGGVYNVATAIGSSPEGEVTSPEDETETPTSADPTTEQPAEDPALELTKRAHLDDTDADGLGDLGESVHWTFEVRNSGDVRLTGVTVDDPLLDELGLAVTCPRDTLRPGQSMTCESEAYTITAADVAAGQVHNVATATGEACSDGACDEVESDPSTTTTQVDPPAEVLPQTGASAHLRSALWAGLFLTASGFVLILTGRRRRHQPA